MEKQFVLFLFIETEIAGNDDEIDDEIDTSDSGPADPNPLPKTKKCVRKRTSAKQRLEE